MIKNEDSVKLAGTASADDYVMGHVARHTGLRQVMMRQLKGVYKNPRRRSSFERGYSDAKFGAISDVAKEVWRMHKKRPKAFRVAIERVNSNGSESSGRMFYLNLMAAVAAAAKVSSAKVERRVFLAAIENLAATRREAGAAVHLPSNGPKGGVA